MVFDDRSRRGSRLVIKGGLKGTTKLKKQVEKLADSFIDNRNMAVKEATLRLHGEAIKIVSENAGGTSDIRYNPTRNVTVSKPGDPPHTDTGRLRQSIKFNYKDGVGQVGSNLKYAAWLEFGTEDMAPRPWLSVAVLNVAKDVDKIFESYLRKAIREGTK